MLTTIETQVLVGAGTSTFSQAISMEGANALSVAVAILSVSPMTQIDIYVQESNDLENWEDEATFVLSGSSTGYSEGTSTGLSMAYVRLRCEIDTDTESVISINANTAKL